MLTVDFEDKLSVLGRPEVGLGFERQVELAELCKTLLFDETLVCFLDCMVPLKKEFLFLFESEPVA